MADNLKSPNFQKAEHMSEKDFLSRQKNFITKKENKKEKCDHVVDNAADSSVDYLLNKKER